MPLQYKAIDPISSMDANKTITSAIWQKIIDDLALHQQTETVLVTNNTGVALVAGDLVVFDTGADGSVILTTTVGDARKVGVVQDPSINIGATGYVIVNGHVPVLNVVATIGRQVALQTSATVKAAQAGAGNTFGVTLTGRTGAGIVEAFIHNIGISSAHVIKDLSTTFAQRADLTFGDGLKVADNSGADSSDVTAPTRWSRVLAFR